MGVSSIDSAICPSIPNRHPPCRLPGLSLAQDPTGKKGANATDGPALRARPRTSARLLLVLPETLPEALLGDASRSRLRLGLLGLRGRSLGRDLLLRHFLVHLPFGFLGFKFKTHLPAYDTSKLCRASPCSA